MKRQHVCAIVLLFGLFACAACDSPMRPSNTVVSAQPISPADGLEVSFYKQPVTLVVSNGATTATDGLTLDFEVSTDTTFANIVEARTVHQSVGDRTSMVLGALPASKNYFWRVKTGTGESRDATSSRTSRFAVGAAVAVQPPTPMQPAVDSLQHKRPTFVALNAVTSGPATTLTYHFDIATDAAFNGVVVAQDVPEGQGQTSFTPNIDLSSGVTYYWRVRATDVTTSVQATSAAQRFTTVAPDDGTFRYDLALRFTPPCQSFVGPEEFPAFTFDDGLVVRGDSLRFTLPPGDLERYPNVPGFELNIQRSGIQLAGTIGGKVILPDYHNTWLRLTFWQHYDNSNPSSWRAIPFVGTADNKGRLTGSFDGTVLGEMLVGMVLNCDFRGATWTLTPHP